MFKHYLFVLKVLETAGTLGQDLIMLNQSFTKEIHQLSAVAATAPGTEGISTSFSCRCLKSMIWIRLSETKQN